MTVGDVAGHGADVAALGVDAQLALRAVAVAQDPLDALELALAAELARVRRELARACARSGRETGPPGSASTTVASSP